MERSCITRMGCPARIVLFFLLGVIVLSAIPFCVSASTPPQYPRMSISVANRTVHPGSGIGVSVEWERGTAAYSPPDTIEIALYRITDGSLLGTYMIPMTVESNDATARRFEKTIPGTILPSGDVMLVATDPVSSTESRVAVRILAPGEQYPDYRSLQVTEGLFYPVAAGLIIVLLAALWILVGKKGC
jgi:hypothetical protein